MLKIYAKTRFHVKFFTFVLHIVLCFFIGEESVPEVLKVEKMRDMGKVYQKFRKVFWPGNNFINMFMCSFWDLWA